MAQDSTIVAGAHVNTPGGGTKQYHSTFPLAFPKLWSYRHGELGLIFADNNVKKDYMYWRLPHKLQSKMLKAPLMQNMTIHKDAFWVAKQCILPNSWENLERFETIGDTAPVDANTVVYNFENKIREICNNWKDRISNGITNKRFINEHGEDTGLVNEIFHFITFAEMFYSCSNLMANAGHPMWILWNNSNVPDGNTKQNKNNYGWWFDKMIEEVFKYTNELLFSSASKQIKVVKSNPKNDNEIDIRTALCYMRDDFIYTIEDMGHNDFSDWNTETNLMNYTIDQLNDIEERPFNYERLCAYQLAVAQYYTNDHIDYVYTAELWRQLMSTYVQNSTGATTYTYNGIKIYYDWLSGNYLNSIITEINGDLADDSIGLDNLKNHFSYIIAIFQIKRSLRFKDYFTGARSQPLAIMDYNVPVSAGNKVSVIDITVKTLWQKLGNAMNRSGNRIEKQQTELYHEGMNPDYHIPFWLGHTSDGIGTPETENTGAAQFELPEKAQGIAITSRFQSNNAGNYMFKRKFDRKGIFLAIQYFEIPRLYSRAVSQFFYKADKFDEFNPYTQFTGDQAIDNAEKDVRGEYGTPFAYTNHDMEYKQRFGIVGGAFIHDLPGWCYIADRTRFAEFDGHITPDYIRALQTEIDELFQSEMGYSIDTWYHFLVKTTIDLTGKRPMAYNPAIGM